MLFIAAYFLQDLANFPLEVLVKVDIFFIFVFFLPATVINMPCRHCISCLAAAEEPCWHKALSQSWLRGGSKSSCRTGNVIGE